jgi:hypothetical protein
LKARIEDLADQYIDEHEVEWVEGKYSVSDRRVLLTKWVGQAWEDMHAEDGEMIRQAFKYVGLGLPIDSSQDHDIKIKDFPDVRVGNWKDWKPTKEHDIEELYSNLTSEEVEKLASEILEDEGDPLVSLCNRQSHTSFHTKRISIKVGTKYFWALGILDQRAHGDAEVLHRSTSTLDLRRPRI